MPHPSASSEPSLGPALYATALIARLLADRPHAAPQSTAVPAGRRSERSRPVVSDVLASAAAAKRLLLRRCVQIAFICLVGINGCLAAR